jgi:hypothetical protein
LGETTGDALNLYFLSNGTIESTALNFKKKKSLAAGYNNVYLEEGNTFVFVNYFFVKIENRPLLNWKKAVPCR